MARIFYVTKPSITNVVPKVCKYCGREITRTFRGEFCSNKCADDYEYLHSHIDMTLMRRNKRYNRLVTYR